VLLAEQVAHEGVVIEVELLAVLAVLDVVFVDVLVIVPPDDLPLRVSFLKGRPEGLLKLFEVEEGPGPADVLSEVLVEDVEVVGVLGLVLELLVDGEVVELVHILQEPQVVVQSLRLRVVHHLADVQELQVDRMHVYVLPLVLLQTEIRLLEGRLEHVVSVVLHRVLGDHLDRVLLSILILQLFGLIVEILPDDITGLLFLGGLEALLAFDDGELLLLEGGFFLDEVEDVLGPILDHGGEVVHAMLGDGLLFGVVLDRQHLAYDRLL
jgi:hypothetical protein